MEKLALGSDAEDVDTVVAPGNGAERVADEFAAEVVPGASAIAGDSVHPAAAVCEGLSRAMGKKRSWGWLLPVPMTKAAHLSPP